MAVINGDSGRVERAAARSIDANAASTSSMCVDTVANRLQRTLRGRLRPFRSTMPCICSRLENMTGLASGFHVG
jgi:hypothetical protein